MLILIYKQKQIKKNIMRKKLTITISGGLNSGKSRLTFLLKNFLREQGLNVNQEVNIDFVDEIQFDSIMSNCSPIEILKDKKIIIKDVLETLSQC